MPHQVQMIKLGCRMSMPPAAHKVWLRKLIWVLLKQRPETLMYLCRHLPTDWESHFVEWYKTCNVSLNMLR